MQSLESRVLLAAQIVQPGETLLSVTPSVPQSVDINYTTDDNDNTLGTFGFRLHYDSSKLQFDSITNVFQNFRIQQQTDGDDTTLNFDNDTATDRFVLVAWADFINAEFPNEPLPLTLYTFNFTPAANFTGKTTLNFSESATVLTHEFGNTPVTVTTLIDIMDGTLNSADSSSNVTFEFDGNVTGFDASDVSVSGGVLSNFAGSGSSYTAVFTANDGFVGTGSVSVGAGSYVNSDGGAGAAGSDTVAIDTTSASAEFTFGFEAIASDIHPSLRYFGSADPNQAPFQIIRYGEITLSSLTGLPATLAAAGNNPSNITITVGSNNPSNIVEVISLDSFDDGSATNVVNQTYRPNGVMAPDGTQTDVPTATIAISGVPVAQGTFEELSLDGNDEGTILPSSTGRIRVQQALGNDSTVFDEIIAETGTGEIEFSLNSFFFTGPATGFGDSELFTSTGASTGGDPNQAPTIGTNSPLLVLEGASGTITTALLNEADPDDSGFGVVYTVTSGPSSGTLRLSGSSTTAFTQADIDAGRVTYQHDGSNVTADSFAFSLADGGEDGVQPATGTFNFSITATNDPPTGVTLQNEVNTLAENVNTTVRTPIADIVVTDDGLGTNDLSLSGTDAALFEIVGSELFLIAGAGLDLIPGCAVLEVEEDGELGLDVSGSFVRHDCARDFVIVSNTL